MAAVVTSLTAILVRKPRHRLMSRGLGSPQEASVCEGAFLGSELSLSRGLAREAVLGERGRDRDRDRVGGLPWHRRSACHSLHLTGHLARAVCLPFPGSTYVWKRAAPGPLHHSRGWLPWLVALAVVCGAHGAQLSVALRRRASRGHSGRGAPQGSADAALLGCVWEPVMSSLLAVVSELLSLLS